EARSGGYDESLMLDVDGYAAEGCGENLFIVRDGRVKHSPISTLLEGITRATAIELMRADGVTVTEERFTRDEIYICDEAFLTGTAAEARPRRSLDDRTSGEGKPGPVTKRLQEAYFQTVRGARSG